MLDRFSELKLFNYGFVIATIRISHSTALRSFYWIKAEKEGRWWASAIKSVHVPA
jgi:hypothetical protein